MDMLSQLGVDGTFFYQFIIFCVAYVILTRLWFKPYMKAHNKRLEITTGNQEVAEKLNAQSEELNFEYEAKAREVNSQVQSFYEAANKEAQAVQAATIEKARKEAEALVQKTRLETQEEANKVRSQLKGMVPELSRDIQKKVLSREV